MEVRTDGDGRRKFALIDFKTAAWTPSGPGDNDADQLSHYAFAAHRSGLLCEIGLPFKLAYPVLTKTKEPSLISLRIEPSRDEALRLIET